MNSFVCVQISFGSRGDILFGRSERLSLLCGWDANWQSPNSCLGHIDAVSHERDRALHRNVMIGRSADLTETEGGSMFPFLNFCRNEIKRTEI